MDLVCVHCYLGFTRFRRAARHHRAEGGTVETVIRPYRLRPDAPATGEPLFEVHKRERGEAAARAIRADTSFGADDGLELNLGRAVFTNTFDAHLLMGRAARQGRAEEMTERLFRAYFTDGLHISDRSVLSRLAAETGVTEEGYGAEELRAELDRTRELVGARAVPLFRFDGEPVLEAGNGSVGSSDLLTLLTQRGRACLGSQERGF
ncbi:DsbA family protein [Streptomyces sp. NA02950]|nr:DsbA family protein [Streptomyces sp. NA02950]